MQITTSDQVSIEAQWHPSTADGPARATVVATHPHPLHGGDMSNTAPATLARELPAHGFSVLRFNFRGVGASTGKHDDGDAEHLDLHAAVLAAAANEPEVPVIIAGYSFGADMALDVLTGAPASIVELVSGILAIAPPLRMFETFSTADSAIPKHLLVPQHDQFRPPEAATEFAAGWTSTTIESMASTDHFLLGATDQMVTTAQAFVAGLL